jgi:spore coat polysaccharide biosynthesis protein SpsF
MDCYIMKIGIIIQARTGSSRFPGKILKKINDKEIIRYLLERLESIIDKKNIVVATTTSELDNSIVNLCNTYRYNCFRGSESDVLSRFYNVAMEYQFDHIIRCNSDCPLIDPILINKICNFYLSNSHKYDYVSNVLLPTFPVGMHIEMFSRKSLSLAHELSLDSIEREHVTPYIYRNPHLFRLYNYACKFKLDKYRVTLDYEEDLIVLQHIIQKLKPKDKFCTYKEIADFLGKNPDIYSINSHILKVGTV